MAERAGGTYLNYGPTSQVAPQDGSVRHSSEGRHPSLSVSSHAVVGMPNYVAEPNSPASIHSSQQAAPGHESGYSQTSLKDSYPSETVPSRSYSNNKSFAARDHARAQGGGQSTSAAHASSLYDPIFPVSPATSYGTKSSTAVLPSSVMRRDSVPDRSPLQKLEVALGDISKEEKRARVEEAEQLARERGNGRSSQGPSREPLPSSRLAEYNRGTEAEEAAYMEADTTREGRIRYKSRSDSPSSAGLVDAGRPEERTLNLGLPPWIPPVPQADQTRHRESGTKRYSGLYEPLEAREQGDYFDRGAFTGPTGLQQPTESSPSGVHVQEASSQRIYDDDAPGDTVHSQEHAQPRDAALIHGGTGHPSNDNTRVISDTRYESGSRNVSGAGSTRSLQSIGRQGRDAALMGSAAAAGVGAYESTSHRRQVSNSGTAVPDDDPAEKRTPRKPVPQVTEPAIQSRGDRSSGNKDSKAINKGGQQLQNHRMGAGFDARAARKVQEADPVTRKEVRNPHAEAPAYEVPPQTAGGQRAREQVGFGSKLPEAMAQVPQGGHHHHLSDVFHRRKESMRKYQGLKPLDEWRQGDVASLSGEDLVIDAGEGGTESSAWLESKDAERWTSGLAQQGKGAPAGTYDGSYDDKAAGTTFQPALYLKCGPLLRYTGMRREPASRAGHVEGGPGGREIWRGSVMIVTMDSQSDYSSAPTLRLFVQPMDLLPPPPAEIDAGRGQQLASAYIDPLAGQPKVSRTGRTVYVKPVERLEEGVDLSRIEDDGGLFEHTPSSRLNEEGHQDGLRSHPTPTKLKSRLASRDGEKTGKFKEVKGVRLHTERGVTFWRFKLEVELGMHQARIAYRINRGPAIGFWVPARGQTMNIVFHSCNGFSASVNPDPFCGPDPLWRDVLNNHQTRPFHVMIGGGDQVYNDKVMRETTYFQEWLAIKNPEHKHGAEFTFEMQDELEQFYLDRYSMWFSQGLFGMANSQIPMINLWDDHDIIDGFGSYPHSFMASPVFCGVGAVAFKYYMLFQHQSVVDESQKDEPSWLLGASPGPYINELSRSMFMYLGKNVAFLGLDCRIERMRDEILSQESYDLIFDRCRREIVKGETKHLIVLLGVPIAYPRLNFVENILTSRVMDPIKALARAGMFGNLLNKFDGGVEILDDLDDHWTAKHHKAERNWFIQELQELAAEKSVRITILGGDVHLAAVGRFFSNKKLAITKDHDHRYMPNIISSAIVNTPPPEMMADVLNRRNKIHHLDEDTDEDMIPLFTNDVDGKPRNNHHLLPRRNWCSIREYHDSQIRSSSPAPQQFPSHQERPGKMTRSLSHTRPGGFIRRLSRSGSYGNQPSTPGRNPYTRKGIDPRVDGPMVGSNQHNSNASNDRQRSSTFGGGYFAGQHDAHNDSQQGQFDGPHGRQRYEEYLEQNREHHRDDYPQEPPHPNPLHRQPTGESILAATRVDPNTSHEDSSGNGVNLSSALDVVINCEVSQKDPAGITTPYRMLVPALWYEGVVDHTRRRRSKASIFGFARSSKKNESVASLSKQRRGDGPGWSQHSVDRQSHDEKSYQQREMGKHAVGGGPGHNMTLTYGGAPQIGRLPFQGMSIRDTRYATPEDDRARDRAVSGGPSDTGPETGYGTRREEVSPPAFTNPRTRHEPLVDEHELERRVTAAALADRGTHPQSANATVPAQARTAQNLPIRRPSDGDVIAAGSLPREVQEQTQRASAVPAHQPSTKVAHMLGFNQSSWAPEAVPQGSVSQGSPGTGGLGIGVPYDPNAPERHYAANQFSSSEHGPLTAGSLRPQRRESQRQQPPNESTPYAEERGGFSTDPNTPPKEGLFSKITRRSLSLNRRPSTQRQLSGQYPRGDGTYDDPQDYEESRGRPEQPRRQSFLRRLSLNRKPLPQEPQGQGADYEEDLNYPTHDSSRADYPPVALERRQSGRGGIMSSIRRSFSLSRQSQSQQRYDDMRTGTYEAGPSDKPLPSFPSATDPVNYQTFEPNAQQQPYGGNTTSYSATATTRYYDASAEAAHIGHGDEHLPYDYNSAEHNRTPEAVSPATPQQTSHAGGRGLFGSLRRSLGGRSHSGSYSHNDPANLHGQGYVDERQSMDRRGSGRQSVDYEARGYEGERDEAEYYGYPENDDQGRKKKANWRTWR